MPYLILIIGVIVSLYAAYRFLVRAEVTQVRWFFFILFSVLYALVLLFFAFTGRIIISIGLLLFLVPFVISYFRSKSKKKTENSEIVDERDQDEE